MARVINIANLQQFTAVNLQLDPGVSAGPKVIPSCVQIVLKWNLAGSKIGTNVLYGRYVSAPTLSVTMANAIKTALTTGAPWTAYNLHLAPSTGLLAVTLRNVATADNPITSSDSAATVGTAISGAMANEVALVASLKTSFTGPRYRGRVYLPGFQQTEVVGGTNLVSASLITDSLAWVGTFTAIFAAQGLTWCLGLPARVEYVGSTGRLHTARAAESPSVLSVAVNNRWDSQRKRGLK